jgi:hypothetical protein
MVARGVVSSTPPKGGRHGGRRGRESNAGCETQRPTRVVNRLVSGDDWLRAVEFAARSRTRSFGNAHGRSMADRPDRTTRARGVCSTSPADSRWTQAPPLKRSRSAPTPDRYRRTARTGVRSIPWTHAIPARASSSWKGSESSFGHPREGGARRPAGRLDGQAACHRVEVLRQVNRVLVT